MNVPVDLDELLAAYEWVSASDVGTMDAEACISTVDGKIYWCGEGVDEDPPEDIDDENLYIAVPHQSDLDLGRSLALRFVAEHLPQSRAEVHEYFRKRGAYSRFKSLLERVGQLESWYQYEQSAKEEALIEWCAENGFTASR